MYKEDEYIQLSALQHYLFCPRQCVLAYMEMIWEENELTALGRLFHYKAHEKKTEKRPGLLIARGLRIYSAELGLSGEADVVEFRKVTTDDDYGCKIKGVSGRWRPFPIEYKRGKPKNDFSDEVQLCAQAIALEEMLGAHIPEGAIFYGKNKRRFPIEFTEELRKLTIKTAQEVHRLLNTGITPAAEYSTKCGACSLNNMCLPKKTANKRGSAASYLKNTIGKFYEKNA